MKNYVISLTTELDRRAHITKEFNSQRIPFEFFDALTPNIAEQFSEKLGFKINKKNLTGGELACFMSHLTLWKKMIDDKISYMGIFEDDIFLGQNASDFLNRENWFDEEIHVVKLEAFTPRVILGKRLYHYKDRDICLLKGSNLGAAGYILSLEGAKALINFISTQDTLVPIDHIIFELYIKENNKRVAQIVPALCIQELELNKITLNKNIYKSSLIEERHERMKKYKLKGFAKIGREMKRIFPTVSNFLLSKKIEFK